LLKKHFRRPSTQKHCNKKMNNIKYAILTIIIGLALFYTASVHAATEFVSIVDPGQGAGSDHSSLSLWEQRTQVDLTATSTLVFSYNPATASGSIPYGATMIGTLSGAIASTTYRTATSASAQILMYNIVGTFQSGEQVYVQGAAGYFVDLTSTGTQAIAVAKCRSTGGSADTTAVTVDGWTTSSSTYIKIWADPNDEYGRHKGKWDEKKYRLEVTGNSSAINAISGNVIVEGLQIKRVTSSTYGTINGIINAGVFSASNNIINLVDGYANTTRAIFNNASGLNAYYWNNIIYGTNLDYGYYQASAYGYLFNNSIINAANGFYSSFSSRMTVMNNVAQGATDGFSASSNMFGAGSNYNISNIANDAPSLGYRSNLATVVQFVDTINNDFHLTANDTAARDAGTSTVVETLQCNVSTAGCVDYDIDNTARGGAFDIGADEVPAEFISTICQNIAAGGDCANMDYGHLGATGGWEDKVETDLSASSTRVFGGSKTGSLSENDVVYLRSALNATSFAKGYIVATTSDQILIDGIISSSSLPVISTSSYVWQKDGSNYWTVSGTGDALGASAVAVAKIDGAWSAAETNSLVIAGWETDNDNDMKVYTTELARHKGKWDETKYRIVITTSASVMSFSENYIWLDGIQIYNMFHNDWSSAINGGGAGFPSGKAKIQISNNIIRGNHQAGTNVQAISFYVPSGTSYGEVTIWNNLIYNWGLGTAIQPQYIASWDIFNNTLINNKNGIYTVLSAIVKNNLIASTTNPFTGTFAASTTNNATDNSDTPTGGTNTFTNQTFSFVSTASGTEDFHLQDGDTGAKNKGFDITASTSLFTTDIDSGTRNADGLGWDIGADEVATKIYRSVGNVSTAISNSATVTISGSSATFSAAQPDNVGVGDVVQYGNSGAYQLAFITSRVSSTQYGVQAWNGTAPSATTTAPMNIYRAHLELKDWEDQAIAQVNSGISDTVDDLVLVGQNLVASNTIMMVPCYAASAVDDANIWINAWTTGEGNYINVYTPYKSEEVGISQRHKGVAGTGYYLQTTDEMRLYPDHVRVDGIEFYNINNSDIAIQDRNDDFSSSDIRISNCLIHGFSNSIYIQLVGTYRIWNNIIYNDTGYAINGGVASSNYYIYNNTIYGLGIVGRGINITSGNELYFYNNLVQNTSRDYNVSTIGSGNNISSDETSPNTSLQNQTVQFIDPANYDFHLSPNDTAAIDAGTSTVVETLQCNVSTAGCVDYDIDGNYRRTWDIGADEASIDFVSTIMQSGGAFSSLSAWEAANQANLIATTTAVFSCSTTNGNIPVGSNVIGYTSGAKASSTVLSTSTNQLLLYNIGTYSPASTTFITGERVYIQGSASTSNYCDLSNIGNPANAVAKIDGAWTVADTNPVAIDGWETGANNYIRIYTTESARHEGVWDEGRYRVVTTGAMNVLNIAENFIKIDGLQIKLNLTTNQFHHGIAYAPAIGDDEIQISNNIIRAEYDNSAHQYNGAGILTNTQSNLRIWNNIIYDWQFENLNNYGISIGCTSAYAYNNTVYNSTNGISMSGEIKIVKNNLSYNNTTTDYSGSFHADSVNNLSSDSSAPGTNSITNATVRFMDEANNDFRLATEDVSAKNTGVVMTEETQNFTSLRYDIAGNERYDTAWDIGAYEAATILYRSVGRHPYDLNTNGATVNIATATADFSASLPDNVGVGDVIQYGNPLQLAFITARSSSTVYSIQDRNGAGLTATTSVSASVYRAHLKLDDWEDQTVAQVNNAINDSVDDLVLIDKMNLTASNTAMHVPCYASSTVDDASATIDSWTTATSSFIRIYTPVSASEVGISQRHNGRWNSEKYNLSTGTSGSGRVLSVLIGNIKIDGLQINALNLGGIFSNGPFAGRGIVISNSIIKGEEHAAARHGIDWNGTAAQIFLYNNIVYGFDYSGSYGIRLGLGSFTPAPSIYNNTVYGCYTGIDIDADGYFKNNISTENVNADYSGTPKSGSSNNLSSDNTSPNSGANDCNLRPCRNQNVLFVNKAGFDFHLSDRDNAAKNNGSDLRADSIFPFSTDADGERRSGSWDIGADEMLIRRSKYIIQPGLGGMRFQGHFEFQ